MKPGHCHSVHRLIQRQENRHIHRLILSGVYTRRNKIENKDNWKWTLMIMQPKYVTVNFVEEAIVQVKEKKSLAALHKVRFEAFTEGKAVQIMHVGPFSAEGPTVEKVHHFIREAKFNVFGKHHEIYLSDIRKSAPEKWKTIIRQPMRA